MERVARGAYNVGGKVIGVCFEHEGRLPSEHNTETLSFSELAPRQAKVIELGQAFVALPGGLGTVYEVIEVLAKKHLGEIPYDTPVILLPSSFWNPLGEFMSSQVLSGFASKRLLDSFTIVNDENGVITNLAHMNQPKEKQLEGQRERWNSRAEEWDNAIQSPDHYANFEDGYLRFLEFEREALDCVNDAKDGIDLGCGTGEAASVMADKVERVYLLDLADKMLEVALRKLPSATSLCASATEVPLPDRSLDVIVSRGIVVSHLPLDTTDRFFDEIRRLIRPGGVAIFDFLSNQESAQFNNVDPKASFTKAKMAKILESRGFIDLIFDGADTNRVIRVAARFPRHDQ
jgi:uncharacterized protein (TIGR00730 family)